MGIYPLEGETDQSSRDGFLRRMRWGAVAFAVATPIVWVIGCPVSWISCGRGAGRNAVAVASFIEILLVVLLFAGRRRWRFTAGFFLAYLVAATFTRGRATIFWTAPANLAIQSARPLWAPAVARQEASKAKVEWLGIKRTQHPSVVHAARLVNLLHECARQAMLADTINSLPRTPAVLSEQPGCDSLRSQELTADSASSRYSESDLGWRWTYTPGPQDPYGRVSNYVVRVAEDPAIGRAAVPEFTGDERGEVIERVAGSPPRHAASPVASLLQLRRCLLRVPDANAALRASNPYLGRSSSMNSVASVCPELARHIANDYPDHDDNRGRLAVPAHEQAGEFTDTVAVYVTQFIPADVDGTIFELRAWPGRVRNPAVRGGVRQFFVARDGSIHARVGEEPATAADPVAAECLPGGGVDCGIAEAAPAPATGP